MFEVSLQYRTGLGRPSASPKGHSASRQQKQSLESETNFSDIILLGGILAGWTEERQRRRRREIIHKTKPNAPEMQCTRALGMRRNGGLGRRRGTRVSWSGGQERRMEEMKDQPGVGTESRKGDMDSMVWRGKRIVDMTRDELEQAFQQLAATHQREMMKHIRQLAEIRGSRR